MEKKIAGFITALIFISIAADLSHAAKRALLIGINEYQYHDEFLLKKGRELNLEGCVEDVHDMKSALIDFLEFSGSEIKTLTDSQATLASIEEAISQWLVEGTAPGDTVLFYYSGHGFLMNHPAGDRTNLCPHDANPFTLKKLLSADRLGELFAGLKGRTLVAVVDSCHSAAAILRSKSPVGTSGRYARPRQFPAQQLFRSSGKTRSAAIMDRVFVDKIFLAACGVDEKAWELEIEGRTRGVFTFGLIRNIIESKGNLSAQSIRERVAEFIKSEGFPQHPELMSKSFLGTRNLRDLFISTPQTLLAGLEDPRPPFRVEVWVTEKGKNSFLIGEKLVFSVRSERQGYLYLISVDSQKTVTLLFPNHLDRDNFIRAGIVVTVPGAKFLSEIRADEPVGQDNIIAVVSTRPWKELQRMEIDQQNIMAILDVEQVSEVVAGALTRSATRGISIRPKTTEAEMAGDLEWALGKIQIEIRR
jgi:hypothetical protein